MTQAMQRMGFFTFDADVTRIEQAISALFDRVWGMAMNDLTNVEFDEMYNFALRAIPRSALLVTLSGAAKCAVSLKESSAACARRSIRASTRGSRCSLSPKAWPGNKPAVRSPCKMA